MTITPVLADQLEDAGVQGAAAALPHRVADRGRGGRRRGCRSPSAATPASPSTSATATRWSCSTRTGGTRCAPSSVLPTEGRIALATSAATHAVLPLLATREGLRLQLDTGIRSHRRRFGWDGGFWLPECAYVPGLEWRLAEHGVSWFCVDQSRHQQSARRAGAGRHRGRPGGAADRLGGDPVALVAGAAIPPTRPTPSSPASRCAACGSGRSVAAAMTRPRPQRRRVARPASSSPPRPRGCASTAPAARSPRPARLRDRHRAARPLVVGGRDLAARRARRSRCGRGAPAHRARGARRARAGRAPAPRLDLGRGEGPAHLGLAGGRRPRLGRAAAGAAPAARALAAGCAATRPSAPRASCSPSSRATGPSSTSAARPATTPTSEPFPTPKLPWRP